MTQKRRLARRTGVRRLIPHSLLPLTLALTSFLVATVLVLAADSDLDPSFDGDGIVTTNQDEFDQINDIAIQPDGKILVAGDTGFIHILSGSRASMMVARYNVNGSLDASFGNNGIVVTSVGDHSLGNDITLQQDGKIVVAGRGDINGQARFAVVRYNANGSLDGTFGNSGVVTTSIGTFAFLTGVAIQSDGKIVASGSATGPGPQFSTFTVARYNTDGSLDVTFDGDGVTQAVPAGFLLSPTVTAWGMALQQDERIVVVGDCNLGRLLTFVCLVTTRMVHSTARLTGTVSQQQASTQLSAALRETSWSSPTARYSLRVVGLLRAAWKQRWPATMLMARRTSPSTAMEE